MDLDAKFITIEGVEGCGKSTQINSIAHLFSTKKVPFIVTREPGDTAIGQKLRAVVLDPAHHHMDPRCEAFIYMADRAQHLAETILPNLERGIWVICDRYHDSTLAYQSMVRGVDGLSYHGFRKPDLTLLLDLDPAIGLKRAIARNSDLNLDHEARFEQEQLTFHLDVRKAFLSLAAGEPDRFALIDAVGSPDQVFERTRPHLERIMEYRHV